ncbi:Translation initiation factor 2A like protein, partial [Aduncisulcus paluster]
MSLYFGQTPARLLVSAKKGLKVISNYLPPDGPKEFPDEVIEEYKKSGYHVDYSFDKCIVEKAEISKDGSRLVFISDPSTKEITVVDFTILKPYTKVRFDPAPPMTRVTTFKLSEKCEGDIEKIQISPEGRVVTFLQRQTTKQSNNFSVWLVPKGIPSELDASLDDPKLKPIECPRQVLSEFRRIGAKEGLSLAVFSPRRDNYFGLVNTGSVQVFGISECGLVKVFSKIREKRDGIHRVVLTRTLSADAPTCAEDAKKETSSDQPRVSTSKQAGHLNETVGKKILRSSPFFLVLASFPKGSRPSSAASFPLPSMAALSKLISDAMASSDVTDVVSAQPYPLIPSMRGDFLTSSLTPH